MGILAIVQTVLEILKEFLTWQVGLTKLKTEKLAYDIDQQEKAKGRDLIRKIDDARNAGDLVATSLYLDDQADSALFTARVRSAVSQLSGPDVGVSGGIPAAPAPDGGTHDGAQSAPSTESGSAVIHGPAPSTPFSEDSSGLVNSPVPSHTIPKPPYSATGLGTWFGWNPATKAHPEGTDDTGDMDSKGHDLKGAFGDVTHSREAVFISIPIPIFHATIGRGESVYAEVRKGRWLFDVYCHATGKHATSIRLGDLGPNASLNRPLDMTAGLAIMLGLNDNAVCTWWVTDTHTGQILEVKGWDFAQGKVVVS